MTESAVGDDIDAYIATFTDEELGDLAAAEKAIDIAIMLYRAREERGLSQEAAAQLAGLQQQAVSRFERPGANPHMETIRTYLAALGYGVELHLVDLTTGESAFSVMLPPVTSKRTA
jgi:DNA-binding XRE family transcriptional regulator